MKIEELVENFELLDDWEDKYRYLIDLGNSLEPLDDTFKTEDFKVKGCQSQVWLLPELKNGILSFKGDSDAIIVRGLIAVVLTAFEGKSPSEIASLSLDNTFTKLGLEEHLSPSRRNGLLSMIDKIRFYAEHLQE